MNKFTLTIKLGNEAMQTGDDVAWLLRKVIRDLEGNPLTEADSQRYVDLNGNSVGEWKVR